MENVTRALTLGGRPAEADLSGALWLPTTRALLVADLHLGKAESLTRRGAGFTPPYDSPATLLRLARAISRFDPDIVVSLGDAFHDDAAAAALADEDRAALRDLARGRRWVWVAGNHDPAPPADLPGESAAEVALDGLTLRHHPRLGQTAAEAAGHLHPYARIRGARGSTGGR
ncbi:MAG: ligase-associated DNA damage response endonuclease PdeM [Pseudomonadota bacterium]